MVGVLCVGVTSSSPVGSPEKSPSKWVPDHHIPSPDHAVSVAASEHFDKAGLIEAQLAALHDAHMFRMGLYSTEYSSMAEGESPTLPSVREKSGSVALKPIRLREMKLGKVHRGRVLIGTLCCKSVKMIAVVNVLEEDGTGDATKIVISNAVPSSATMVRTQQLYPEGAKISVRHPYLKRFSDGLVGIFVDSPADLEFNWLPRELYESEDHTSDGQSKSPNWINGPVSRVYLEVASPKDGLSDVSVPRTLHVEPSNDALRFGGRVSAKTSPLGRTSRDNSKDDVTRGPLEEDEGEVSFPEDEVCARHCTQIALEDEVFPSDEPYVESCAEDDGFVIVNRGRNADLAVPFVGGHEEADDSRDGCSIGSTIVPEEDCIVNTGSVVDSLESVCDSENSAEFGMESPQERKIDSGDNCIVNTSCVVNGLANVCESQESDVGTECPEERTITSEEDYVVNTSCDGVKNACASGGLAELDMESPCERTITTDVHFPVEVLTGAGCQDRADSVAGEFGLESPQEGHVDNYTAKADSERAGTASSSEDSWQEEEEVEKAVVGYGRNFSSALCQETIQDNARYPSANWLKLSMTNGTTPLEIVSGDEIAASSTQSSPREMEFVKGVVEESVKNDVTVAAEVDSSVSASEILDTWSHDVVQGHKADADNHVCTDDAEIVVESTMVDKCRETGVKFAKDDALSCGTKGSSDNHGDNEGYKGARTLQDTLYDDGGARTHEFKLSKGNHLEGDLENLTASALRIRGNQLFAQEDMVAAVELYSRAIVKAIEESKSEITPSTTENEGEEPESEVVMDYSNRAEAWLRLHQYERACADADIALSMDSKHLKSLFRKGRALLGLGDFQQALAHLKAAYSRAPFDKELVSAIHSSRIGDHQSRLGIFDLSGYFIRGRFIGEIPCVQDFVGPVQVNVSSENRSRGLFLTKDVRAGDLLLVSNSLAYVESNFSGKSRRNVLDVNAKGRLGQEVEDQLVSTFLNQSMESAKDRELMSTLFDGEASQVPAMDVFKPGRRHSFAEVPKLDEDRLHRIVTYNVIDRNMVSTSMERMRLNGRGDSDVAEERMFYGLWALPSFINHSCLPNVSMVVIGRALFVFAARELTCGEEVTTSYFNIFQPLNQRRELSSRCWGFTCDCARCLLESRFESSLKRLYPLHSRLDPKPTWVLQVSPFLYKASEKEIAKELESLDSLTTLDGREKAWLRASIVQLYIVNRDVHGLQGNHPYLETILEAMMMVAPGCSSSLEVAILARDAARKDYHGERTSMYKNLNQLVLYLCQCTYGRQKSAVLQSLVDSYSRKS